MRILFVCLGNICRSPLAEAILIRQADEAGVEIEVDSAGTGSWHIGELPDSRAREEGQRRGCRMDMRARQVEPRDFQNFDLIVAMDRSNAAELHCWPGADSSKVRLAKSFDPLADGQDIHDPFYGGPVDFAEVADELEACCQGILKTISAVK